MAGQYIGVSNVARKVSNQYVGVSNVARKVTKGYVGVGNVAKQHYSSDVTLKITKGTNYSAGYIVVNGSSYYTSTTLALAPGTSISCYANGGNIYLNGTYVGSYTYNYTVTTNTNISLEDNAYYDQSSGQVIIWSNIKITT